MNGKPKYWLVTQCYSELAIIRRLVNGVDVSYSFAQMKEDGIADWDGVRNYQARNIMRDQMSVGDKVLYYHSNTKVPGIVGIVQVHRAGYPDECAWDPKDPHFDPKTDKLNPKWFKVDLEYVRPLQRLLSLAELKSNPKLANMALVKSGRLSVQPVKPSEWETIMQLEQLRAPSVLPSKKGSKRPRGSAAPPAAAAAVSDPAASKRKSARKTKYTA